MTVPDKEPDFYIDTSDGSHRELKIMMLYSEISALVTHLLLLWIVPHVKICKNMHMLKSQFIQCLISIGY